MEERNLDMLVLGSDARSHVLYDSIMSGEMVGRVLWGPGNGGTKPGVKRSVSLIDHPGIIRLCKEEGIDFLVCSPEGPFAADLVGNLQRAGIAALGPGKFCAQLESSKTFTRSLGKKIGLPQPLYRVAHNYDEAERIIKETGFLVVKRDGLAAGKGVVVAKTTEEAKAVAHSHFAQSNEPLLLEEKLVGREYSVIGICDGWNVRLLPAACDYKRAYDGDDGPNTGGMGAYSFDLSAEKQQFIERTFFLPVLKAMRELYGTPYHGFLYASIMETATSLKLIEFNVRLGDPEAQVILSRLLSDIVPYLIASMTPGGLASLPPLEVSPRQAVCVVLAAPGYPDAPETGQEIHGWQDVPAEVGLYHAGTRREGDKLFVSGGRALSVVGMGDTLAEARAEAYDVLGNEEKGGLWFLGMHYRTDIGAGF